jgi:hypothetical protein
VQLDGDQRSVRRVEDPVRCGGADEAVAAERARGSEHRDLRILREVVGDLAVARLDLAAHELRIEHLAAGSACMPSINSSNVRRRRSPRPGP